MNLAKFKSRKSWNGGLVGQIKLKNQTSKSVEDWEFSFEAPFGISNIWRAKIVRKEGNRYTIRNIDWNGQPTQGKETTFGFVATMPKGNIVNPKNQPARFSLKPAKPTSASLAQTAIKPASDKAVADKLVSGEMKAKSAGQQQGIFRYGEALQKSFLFYEAQRAGKLPEDNRIDWRNDSTLKDGADVGLDLSGGYFDAGDRVKFGLPMAASMTLLAWGVDEYRQSYQRSNQLDEAMDTIKWGTDYILNAHVVKNGKTQAFYGQVGLGEIDHAYFGPVEDMDIYRPSLKIDANQPGTDLAAEASAALAAAALVFEKSDPTYARKLVRNARKLYEFADTYRDRYSNSIKDAKKFYESWDGYQDDLAWSATWLYKATGDQTYLDKAEETYSGVGWTQSWADKSFGTSVLLAQENPQQERYQDDAETWLDNWAEGNNGVKYTSGGFAWIDRWGSAQKAATAAFISGVYSDTVKDPKGTYSQFANDQIDYLLGDNPADFSYMVGFGDRYPKQPHHRNAAGTKDFKTPTDNKHTLFGALVGGLRRPNDQAYQDKRSDYIANEAALYYNAGFTGALARMYSQFGGNPLSDAQIDALPGISVVTASS